MQPTYDHSHFVQPVRFEEYDAGLTAEQRREIHTFYTDSPDQPEASHYRTVNNIFVSIHHDQNPDTLHLAQAHTVATCRRIGHTMLRENCDVQDVLLAPTQVAGHLVLDKILHLKGRETSRLATITLGGRALWIEQDHEGYAAHYPLLAFDPTALKNTEE